MRGAWQAAKRGVHVLLYEMRPNTTTEPIKAVTWQSLVCSNSLGSMLQDRASGILKNENKDY
jgi:methylenetetrahydrofolate--tRNA-(uracil-5-)-methyltransferase